ncbi:MAG: NADH-quinone oxidoreductase chain 2 [Alphaproteobacteria bacterium MarineAlpha9_Bin4]|nr:NADH-quinone oxidoreductase subunit NuoE [Pelagibacterales bacterium]PPR27523.1 MAG: NADH-quinone oxidoreductase chain 2 [Alphaproteobacteria bacterium MarineAlpha9_Bin4]|tara:strand:+ start:1318 stop:1914 length:597 start_codon:yes stop_codon:yes gene_type:complete
MNLTEKSKFENFKFSKENSFLIDNILKKYPANQLGSAVMPLLDLAMRQCNGWIPEAAMKEVGRLINIPFIKVYEVATFYSMFNLKPIGKYFIQFCTTTPCWLNGSDDLLEACKKYLKIKCGETTEDGLFTLKEVECLGACVNAPMVQINDDYFEDLNKTNLIKLLNDLKNENKVKIGTQIIGRRGAEPFKNMEKNKNA